MEHFGRHIHQTLRIERLIFLDKEHAVTRTTSSPYPFKYKEMTGVKEKLDLVLVLERK